MDLRAYILEQLATIAKQRADALAAVERETAIIAALEGGRVAYQDILDELDRSEHGMDSTSHVG